MGTMDRKALVQWDLMKRILGLSVLVLMTMVGWVVLQHRHDVQKCLLVHSEEAQQLHKDLMQRLKQLETQAATHHSNLTQSISSTLISTTRNTSEHMVSELQDLKSQLSTVVQQLQASSAASSNKINGMLSQMQQQLKSKLGEVTRGLGGIKSGNAGDELKAGVIAIKTSLDGFKLLMDEIQHTLDVLHEGIDVVKDTVDGVQDGVNALHSKELGQLPMQQSAAAGLDRAGAQPAATSACPKVCVDVAFMYHNDDKRMFVDNGVLEAARKHLQGIRRFWVVSQSNSTFLHLLDDRTAWFNEGNAPFTKDDWASKKSQRPLGWLYQQALKLWIAEFLPNSCGNIMFVDSDTVWLRDFSVVTKEEQEDGTCKIKFKYNLSTQKTGAWYGDIVNPEYHHFVKYITGLNKALANTHTAINHWQLMQRDVVKALARSIAGRTEHKTIAEAMLFYGLNYNGMSEYEAYFSFAWYFYPDRLDMVHLPFVMRDPKRCDYDDEETTLPFREKTQVYYFTCHDTYAGRDYYTNCKGREKTCDPDLASEEAA